MADYAPSGTEGIVLGTPPSRLLKAAPEACDPANHTHTLTCRRGPRLATVGAIICKPGVLLTMLDVHVEIRSIFLTVPKHVLEDFLPLDHLPEPDGESGEGHSGATDGRGGSSNCGIAGCGVIDDGIDSLDDGSTVIARVAAATFAAPARAVPPAVTATVGVAMAITTVVMATVTAVAVAVESARAC